MADDKFTGRKLDDRYLLQRRLDAGSFGAVYEAVDLKFDSTVAVKILFEQNLESASAFRKEARLARQFKHSNVVTVFDYGSDKKLDVGYIVMEFLKGCRLDQLIVPGSPITDRMIAKFTDEVGSALQSAHERQLVHRDLKPRNVMLVDEGTSHERFVLLDLGLASQTDSTATLRNQTLDGAMTPHYASPEQFNQGTVEFPSDIYSFGTVLYELISGRIPFPREQLLGMMMAICNDPPPPFSQSVPDRQVPPALEEVVMQCLEKRPENRPASMQEVRERVLASMGFATGFYDFPGRDTSQSGQHSTLTPDHPAVSGRRDDSREPFDSKETIPPPAGSGSDISVTAAPAYAAATGFTGTLQPGQSPNQAATGTLHPDGTDGFAAGDTSPPARHRTAGWGKQRTRRQAVHARRLWLTAALFLTPLAIAAAVFLNSGGRDDSNGGAPGGGNGGGTGVTLTDWVPPAGFVAVADFEPVVSESAGVRYPACIDRVFDDGLTVRFRLILPPENVSREWRLDPFYVMETKVWNALFARYWDEAGRSEFTGRNDDAWQLGGQANGEDLPASEYPQNPVFRMHAMQAYRFGVWLGGETSCHLPSREQWKLAAGLPQWEVASTEQQAQFPEGPYEGMWQPGISDIGVDRYQSGPLPVATSLSDITLTGCRGMAGNGEELTENIRGGGRVGPDVPLPSSIEYGARVEFLGKSYISTAPLQWSDLRKTGETDATGYVDVDPKISFRVVLETH